MLFLALGAIALRAQQPGTNLQVYLMTMGPGADIDTRFGHNAIWIRDTVARTDLVYNFGTFHMEPTPAGLFKFGVKFAMGPMRYWLGLSDLEETLRTYRHFERDLTAQLLNLTPAQRADIAQRLAVNVREENRYYMYDYFRDNCSTRVRDLLDIELGGALKAATTGKPAEGTYRWHTRRSLTNNIALFASIDAAFARNSDRPIDQWQEMYLPAKVQQRVRELTVADSSGARVPLVAHELTLLDINVHHVEQAPPSWTARFFLVGLLLAALIALSRQGGALAIAGRFIGAVWLLLMGIGGVILVFFWTVTKHWATYANINLLLLSPLALLLVAPLWRRNSTPFARNVAKVLMISTTLGGILAMLPAITGQQNTLIAALVALPTFTAAWLVSNGTHKKEL